jgi:hypothetical protein
MLTKLRFKNFKAWEDTTDIRLAPLTVLFGGNSAGKTSIPQLLLLLKQTAESPDRQRALQLGDSRTLIDAGTFDDVLYGHDIERPLDFELEWSLDGPLEVSDPLSGNDFAGDRIAFAASLRADKRHQPVTERFDYALKQGAKPTLDLAMRRQQGGGSSAKAAFDLSSNAYNLVRHQGRAWPLPEPLRFYGFPDEVAARYQNAAFASDLVLELERMLRSIFYVGPLREHPRRLYLWSGDVPDHVGIRGDRAVEAILAAQDRSFNWTAKAKTKTLPTVVAERLRTMGLIQDFQVKGLGQHRKEYEVLVRTHPKLPEVKLTDVGFGVSQVLPVIVEAFYVPRRSIVIFEQPEIHLHPRVQADLADLFVDAINAREHSAPRDCQFIIESHSEHFLRRLQRRIAEGSLSKDQTAFYFVDTVGESAHMEELDVFGDEMGDLVARSEAQAKRMGAEKKSK